MTGTMKWEIVHVPGEPESSLEVSTVDVLASKIEPKLANKIVRQLNQVCPLENLRHVKRVRKRTVEGNAELSVILCLSDEYEKDAEAIPRGIHQLISDYNLCPYNAIVAKYAARSKEEWEEQCKLWPTSYHPSTNLDGVSGLSEGELQLIFNYMKVVIQLTKLSYTGGKEHSLVKEVPDNREPTEIMRPYLCTGFDIYLLWEPCTMTAGNLCAKVIENSFLTLI
ncbi:Hydrolase zinc ion binding protein [Musa troglodytarum]|uniref:Hydrolase zinc ion binding protein n=1 Tax=Musa troglodytarum TaxID=320322 RepID=A0A9E7EJP6_9LILI|nr:Hydrolase zinc ion binding protein [Musa troglodytarum]